MKMPGFTAETSLYLTNECYNLMRNIEAMHSGKEVLPQVWREPWDWLRGPWYCGICAYSFCPFECWGWKPWE